MSAADRSAALMGETARGQGPGPIHRAAGLLKLLAESDNPLSVSDVAAGLGLPPSTSHRLLHQFIGEGFVVADLGSKRYKIGPELHRVAALIQAKTSLATTVQPFLDELTAACDEASLFAVYDRATATVAFVAKADSSQALGYRISLNTPVSAYWGSSSQVILAHLPEPDLRRVLAEAQPSPVGGRPPAPEEEFRAYLASIRERGWILTTGEKLPGGVGTSAPVFGAAGIAGSLTVTIPEVRFQPSLAPKIQHLVVEAAARVSAVLGYRGEA